MCPLEYFDSKLCKYFSSDMVFSKTLNWLESHYFSSATEEKISETEEEEMKKDEVKVSSGLGFDDLCKFIEKCVSKKYQVDKTESFRVSSIHHHYDSPHSQLNTRRPP